MTSSSERGQEEAAVPPMRDNLPPALRSMWRLCKLGYRHAPGLMLVAFGLSLLSALPDALLAWGSHDELMATGGQYSELYAIQAAAYAN